MYYLIDTNVPLAANGKSSAEPACMRAAAARLRQLQLSEILVLDDGFLILKEYQNKLSPSGQPGVGDAFYLWALRNRSNSRHCELVTLEMAEDGGFAAFPTRPELAAFDLSDRKFVAAALTHPARPPVVNATDSDWHHHREALAQQGVRIEFLCPAEMDRPRR
ncbi:hypothetical protein Q5H93_18475 [Hymenobacter sp. ASUV-10]|uniref:PIN domain-containing protein n=1 Tax=Hymenobacter aranciens TaxID=3063996 RepID=A0ABT9BES5_9BACT|nr:hypothetical protein [Hymenobacter sp. ASUV-10]MDO7876737.1 hypothetical protein [Hymenobacter sp. ASUV-10]